MPNTKTDNQGFSTENADKQRDDSAKGGAMTGPGTADSKHGVNAPYDADTQTQLAANSHKKNQENKNEEQDDAQK